MADTDPFDALALGIAKKYELPADAFLHLAKKQPGVKPDIDVEPVSVKPQLDVQPKAPRVPVPEVELPDMGGAPEAPETPRVSLASRALAGEFGNLDLGGLTKVPGKPTPRTVAKVGNIPVAKDFSGPASKNAKGLLGLINQYLGTPYSWGGGGPGGPSRGFGRGAGTVGFDCSSFLQFLMAKQGVKIPRVTYDQWKTGTPVSRGQLRPGDAVFFRPGPRGPEHVGIYVGNNTFAQAPKTGDVIKFSKLTGYYAQNYMGARRYR